MISKFPYKFHKAQGNREGPNIKVSVKMYIFIISLGLCEAVEDNDIPIFIQKLYEWKLALKSLTQSLGSVLFLIIAFFH